MQLSEEHKDAKKRLEELRLIQKAEESDVKLAQARAKENQKAGIEEINQGPTEMEMMLSCSPRTSSVSVHMSNTILPPALFSSIVLCAFTTSSSANVLPT